MNLRDMRLYAEMVKLHQYAGDAVACLTWTQTVTVACLTLIRQTSDSVASKLLLYRLNNLYVLNEWPLACLQITACTDL